MGAFEQEELFFLSDMSAMQRPDGFENVIGFAGDTGYLHIYLRRTSPACPIFSDKVACLEKKKGGNLLPPFDKLLTPVNLLGANSIFSTL
jgi:hypothetical protein